MSSVHPWVCEVTSSAGTRRSDLGVCLQFAVPEPFGTRGLKRTKFSWLGAWGMEDGVETQRKMGMPGGYTGSSVGRPDGFLNDWHGADLLCTGTSQQFDWPAA